MIKLTRCAKPLFLDDNKEDELIKEYKSKETAVWNNLQIKEPLLNSSNGKCAYCECNLTEESKYMEVEHFEDKKHNPDKVVKWDNLLPSCKKCNASKGTHDVISEPILNPYIQNPREHLGMRYFRMRGLTELGKDSIEVIGLNNQARLVVKRFEVGNTVAESIETAWERYNTFKSNGRTQSKNRLINLVETLLLECQPEAIYAATTSTVTLTDNRFIKLVDLMKEDGLWSDELDKLFVSALSLTLPSD